MKKKQGAALILVLFVTSLLGVISLQYWYLIGLQGDIIIQRERFYQQLDDAERVLDNALEFVTKRYGYFLSVCELQKKVFLDVDHVRVEVSKVRGEEGVCLLISTNHLRCLIKRGPTTSGQTSFVTDYFRLTSWLAFLKTLDIFE